MPKMPLGMVLPPPPPPRLQPQTRRGNDVLKRPVQARLKRVQAKSKPVQARLKRIQAKSNAVPAKENKSKAKDQASQVQSKAKPIPNKAKPVPEHIDTKNKYSIVIDSRMDLLGAPLAKLTDKELGHSLRACFEYIVRASRPARAHCMASASGLRVDLQFEAALGGWILHAH